MRNQFCSIAKYNLPNPASRRMGGISSLHFLPGRLRFIGDCLFFPLNFSSDTQGLVDLDEHILIISQQEQLIVFFKYGGAVGLYIFTFSYQ